MQIQPRFDNISLPNGISLHVVDWSASCDEMAGHSTPVILVHGLASNARLWDCAARELTRLGHRVIAIDQRGHGRSDKPDDGYDIATVTNDLSLLIDSLVTRDVHWSRPLVIGQSWGGNVVIELAHRCGDKIRGVCAVDGGIIHLQRHFPDWNDCASVMAPPRLAGTKATRLRSAIRSMHPDWHDDAVDGAMHNMEHLDDGTVQPWLTFDRHITVLRGLWEHSPFDLFASINVPVMLMPAIADGDDDKRARAREADELLARGLICWFDNADHDLHAQQPENFARAVHDAIVSGHFPSGVLT